MIKLLSMVCTFQFLTGLTTFWNCKIPDPVCLKGDGQNLFINWEPDSFGKLPKLVRGEDYEFMYYHTSDGKCQYVEVLKK
jgi:hypothetical protein